MLPVGVLASALFFFFDAAHLDNDLFAGLPKRDLFTEAPGPK